MEIKKLDMNVNLKINIEDEHEQPDDDYTRAVARMFAIW